MLSPVLGGIFLPYLSTTLCNSVKRSSCSCCVKYPRSIAAHVGGWDVHLLWSKDIVAYASSKADTSTIYGLIAIELNELLTLFGLICV